MKVIIFNKYFFVNTLIFTLLIQFIFFLICSIFRLYEFNSLFINLLAMLCSLIYCFISYILVPINILGIIVGFFLKKQINPCLQTITGFKLIIIYIIAAISFCISIWTLYDISRPPTQSEIEELRYD